MEVAEVVVGVMDGVVVGAVTVVVVVGFDDVGVVLVGVNVVGVVAFIVIAVALVDVVSDVAVVVADVIVAGGGDCSNSNIPCCIKHYKINQLTGQVNKEVNKAVFLTMLQVGERSILK